MTDVVLALNVRSSSVKFAARTADGAGDEHAARVAGLGG